MQRIKRGTIWYTIARHHESFLQDVLTFEQNGSDGLSVALKELQYLPNEEVDYSVEAAWKQEINALEETRELEDNHLINPIAAFKRGQSQYYPEYFLRLDWNHH